MKTRFLMPVLASALFIITSTSSCKKESTAPGSDSACSGCETILAQAANDSTSEGVYKGVVVSGTGIGHLRLNLKAGVDQTFMTLKFTRDGYDVVNDSLKYSGNLVIVPNSTLYATLRGSASRIDFNVQQNGMICVSSDVSLSGGIGIGPYPQTSTMKEFSNAQVKVFEGTMTGPDMTTPRGKVGFVVRGSKIEGILTNESNALRARFSDGVLDGNNTFSFSYVGDSSVYSGQLVSATQITGTFTMHGASAGSFKASRTL